MSEGRDNLEINYFDLPEDEVLAHDLETREELREARDAKIASLEPFPFTEGQQALLEQAKEESIGYFRHKFQRLGFPESLLEPTPHIYFVKANTDSTSSVTGGENNVMTGTTVVYVDGDEDLLSLATTQAHELSHKLTRSELRFHWSEVTGGIKSATIVDGLKRARSDGVHFDALENGLATLDNVDIYFLSLQRLFPDLAQRHRDIVQRGPIEEELRMMNWSRFRPIPMLRADPFVSLCASTNPGDEPESFGFKRVGLETYRFIEEVCKTLGYSTLHATSPTQFTDSELIQKGRDILDYDRYTKSNEGLKAIVRIFGKENAKIIFKADDYGDYLVEAMDVVLGVQEKLDIPSNSTKR